MKKIILVLTIFLLISTVSAQVMISEIMYNPTTPEQDKEWIELYNNGVSSVNMSGWKIQYGSTDRSLTLHRGSFVIEPNSFTIIARNAAQFEADYPGYAKNIIQASISLSNSGKDLYLLDESENIIDNVNYTGIADDGYSVEIKDADLDNSDMNNWQQGVEYGDPGNILGVENNDDETQDIPEFTTTGFIGIILISVLLIMTKRKTS